MDDKSDTDTRQPNEESRPAKPRWQPAHPGDRPPQELVDAALAQDRDRIDQIRDPHLQLLMLKLAEAARQSDGQANTALECFLAQADALMNFVHNRIPLARELDILKQFRAGLIALQDYNAGSDAKLRAVRGKAPKNTTKPKRPSAARERGLIRLFVHVLMGGGMDEVEAEKRVARFVSDNGLKRTRLGVHGVCVAIDLGEAGDKIGADQFETQKARLPADAHQWDDEQRLAWVKQGATVFRKL